MRLLDVARELRLPRVRYSASTRREPERTVEAARHLDVAVLALELSQVMERLAGEHVALARELDKVTWEDDRCGVRDFDAVGASSFPGTVIARCPRPTHAVCDFAFVAMAALIAEVAMSYSRAASRDLGRTPRSCWPASPSGSSETAPRLRAR